LAAGTECNSIHGDGASSSHCSAARQSRGSPSCQHLQRSKNSCDLASKGSALFFRASLAIPKGWQEDQAATKKLNMQVLVPRGKTYDNAEAMIYATVTFNPEKKPIADFIAEDHALA